MGAKITLDIFGKVVINAQRMDEKMWKKLRCETIMWHTFIWVREPEGSDMLRLVWVTNNEWVTVNNNRLGDRSDRVSLDKQSKLLDEEPLLCKVHRGDDWKRARFLKCVRPKGPWFLSYLQNVAQPWREPGEGRRTLHLLQRRPWSWSWFSGDDILRLLGL